MVRAMIGGLQKVIHKRLYRDEEEELVELAPQIWDWLALLPAAARAAAPAARRAAADGAFEERQAVDNPPERVLRALAAVVAEKGYPATTVAEVVDRASTSQRDLLRALRQQGRGAAGGARQRLGADARRRPCPPSAARPTGSTRSAAPTRRCSPSAPKSPSTRRSARSRCTRRASGRWNSATTIMEGDGGPARPGLRAHARRTPIAAEAIGGAIYALIYDQVKAKRRREHAGAGADGHLHDPGPVPRRRGGLRGRQRRRPRPLAGDVQFRVGVAETVDRVAVFGDRAEDRSRVEGVGEGAAGGVPWTAGPSSATVPRPHWIEKSRSPSRASITSSPPPP